MVQKEMIKEYIQKILNSRLQNLRHLNAMRETQREKYFF